MKTRLATHPLWLAAASAGVLALGPAAPAPALGFLKRDRKVPTQAEHSAAESAASAALASAQSQESSGQFGKALSAYRSIAKNYPRSSAAAESQFKVGELLQAEGKDRKAFEAYQKMLTTHKGSPRYSEAVQRQFSIAENLRLHGKKGFLGGIGAEIQPSKLIEFYEQIAESAPRTEIAAQSRVAMGTIQAKRGDLVEARATFESVVTDYPGTQYASEAQFNLFNLHGRQADKSFSPVDLRQQREAGEDFISQFGSDPRTQDIQQRMGGISARESEKAYEVGRFYERSGDDKAAAIYYREVMQHPGTKHYQEAQQRLAKLVEKNPSLAEVTNPRRAPAQAPAAPESNPLDLPPAPALSPPPASPPAAAEPSAPLQGDRPRLRASPDDVLPIPSDDPLSGN